MPQDAAADRVPLSATADPAEVARFSALAAEWWNPHGKFKPLHRFNPVRLAYLRDRLTLHFRRDRHAARPLAGLRLLDVGCGGGLLAEPMTRLGAQVTGIDASGPGLAVARLHAAEMGLAIDYRDAPVEALAAANEQFDVVLNMEVVEHVADRPAFLAACAAVLAPGGAMVTATLNRTARAFAFAIVGAEYVLGWLPRGTHEWNKFVRPDELRAEIEATGLTAEETVGVSYSPLADRWSLSRDMGINYMVFASKPAESEWR